MSYKIGSLFDGSGGFPLAGAMCGFVPTWAAEVEPYPIAVTRSRFPNMRHLGDVSKLNGADIEPVDIICGGSPCQDLSVAGKRCGLKHIENGDEETTRSGLFMEMVRIIKEMRNETNGEYPTFVIWENVPGAFSSNNGNDFRLVLEEFIKIAEPQAVMPAVPKGGWAYADCYCGDGWSLAYRVFDAQYWGVPQRRRRIHLVLDLRGERAGKILFEREGLRGYFAEGRTPWQTAPGDSANCSGAAGIGFDGYNGDLTGAASATLGVNCGVSTERNGVIERIGGLDALGLTNRGFYSGDKAETLRAESHGAIPMAVAPVPYTLKIRSGCEGGGKGPLIQTDKSATLSCNNDQTLFEPCSWDGGQISPTLTKQNAGGGQRMPDKDNFNCVLQPFGICSKDSTLVAKGPGAIQSGYAVRRLTPTECARLQGFPDDWGHIVKKQSFTSDEYKFWLNVRNIHAAINGKTVKDYTEAQMVKWYNKLHTDSAEYKMWGNGIALPPALYCMQGIQDALERMETKKC